MMTEKLSLYIFGDTQAVLAVEAAETIGRIVSTRQLNLLAIGLDGEVGISVGTRTEIKVEDGTWRLLGINGRAVDRQ